MLHFTWVVTRYGDVLEVLRDPETYSKAGTSRVIAGVLTRIANLCLAPTQGRPQDGSNMVVPDPYGLHVEW